MLLDLELITEAERDFQVLYDLTQARPPKQLNTEELGQMSDDMRQIMTRKRDEKRFPRVQKNNAEAGRKLYRQRFLSLPILPDPVKNPPKPLFGMRWAKTGEYWPEVKYEKDKSKLGLLMYSAASHNMFRLKHASIEHNTGCMRLKVDTIQEAISEAFILYGQLGLDVETQSSGQILTPIQWRFMDYAREGSKRRAVMA